MIKTVIAYRNYVYENLHSFYHKILALVPVEHHGSLCIESVKEEDRYGSYGSAYVEVTHKREETAEEAAERITKERMESEKRKSYDLQQLAILKSKYEAKQ